MTISISNSTFNNNAPAGTIVGVLTAQDASGTVTPCNFTLTKNSAGFFAISRNSLITAFSGSFRWRHQSGTCLYLALLFFLGLGEVAYALTGTSPSVDLSVTVTSASGCQLGNHGLVRGRPRISNGTILAEDGCLLRSVEDTASNPSPLPFSYYQPMPTVGHFNALRELAFFGNFLDDTQPGRTLAQIESDVDTWVNYTQQLGMYLLLNVANITQLAGPTYCQDWSADTTLWQALAPRYANTTNVIFQIGSEPDDCLSRDNFATIATNMQTLYQTVRGLAPNTPILAWQFLNPFWVYQYGPGIPGELQAAPNISYVNAAVDFHSYAISQAADLSKFINDSQGAGYPVMQTEGPSVCGNLDFGVFESAKVSWTCSTGFANPPSFTVTWPLD
jgi:hypothetical protein